MTRTIRPAPPMGILRRWALRFGRALLSLGVLVVAAWLAGRLLSDRFACSQFLFWIPTPLALLATLVLVLCWTLLRLASPGPRWHVRVLWGGWAAWVLLAAGLEFHAWRYLAAPEPASPRARVMVWNVSETYLKEFPARIASQAPDVLVAGTPPSFPEWLRVLRQFGDNAGAVRSRYIAVVSRYPVRRWGVVSLDITPPEGEPLHMPSGGRLSWSGGEAIFVELDSGAALGRPLVLWALDVPSDPRLPRQRLMAEARAAIASWSGPMFARDAEGRDMPTPLPAGTGGFPEPDLIVGDLNTPRGSASLRLLTGGMPEAFDQAGRGWGATFPRRVPLLAIDHVFVSPSWRACAYDVVDLGGGRHRAIVADITPR